MRNQVFIGDIAAKRIDFAATLIAKVGFDVCQFFADDLGNALRFGKNIHKINDFAHQVFIFADNFFLIKTGQVTQAHAQNGIGLQFAQVIALAMQAQIFRQAFRAHHVQVQIRTAEHVFNQATAPWSGQQFFFGFRRIGRFFNQTDDFVDIGQGHRFTFGNMAFMTRFFQAE